MGRRVLGVVITVIAVAVSVVSSFYVFGADGYVSQERLLNPTVLTGLSFAIAIGAAVMLCWRHEKPELVLGIALVPPLLASDSMAALIALAALAAARRDRLLWLGGALTYLVTVAAVWRDAGWHPKVTMAGTWVPDAMPGKLIGAMVTAAVFTAIPLTVGVLRGTRADLRQRELREAALRDEMTRQEERSRIAHEMHDVLGHRLSLLSLQAGALEVVDPNATGDVARTVRTTAKQSLDDLRQVIGVLRDGRDYQLSSGPVPALTDLPALVAETRQAGVPVNLTVMLDQVGSAPAPLAMAVYRVVQESLTNILRHAPGAPTDVTVRGGPGAGVTLEVVNPLVTAPPNPGAGTGLTGISERATALGGNASAGPTPEGTFAVRAWLPWPLA
jgi:signal transduction histidine kinase